MKIKIKMKAKVLSCFLFQCAGVPISLRHFTALHCMYECICFLLFFQILLYLFFVVVSVCMFAVTDLLLLSARVLTFVVFQLQRDLARFIFFFYFIFFVFLRFSVLLVICIWLVVGCDDLVFPTLCRCCIWE